MRRAVLREAHEPKTDGNVCRTCVNKTEEVNQAVIQIQKVWLHRRHDRAADNWAVVSAASEEPSRTPS